jgi:hypothetical protein
VYGSHHRRSDDYRNYQCAAWRKNGTLACRGVFVSERVGRRAIEDLLIEHLEALQLRRFLDQAAEDEATQTDGEIAQGVLVALQETEDAIQRLVDAVAEGVFTAVEARTKKLSLMEKKERLQGRLTRLRERAQVRDELLEGVQLVASNLPDCIRRLDGARFRTLARVVFAHVTVISEGSGPARTGRVLGYELSERYRALLSTFGTSALVEVIDSSGVPNRGLERVRTSTKTNWSPSRATKSISPARQR